MAFFKALNVKELLRAILIEAWLGSLSSLPWVEELMHVASFKDWHKSPSLGIGIFWGRH
jgi:hypothetical protein